MPPKINMYLPYAPAILHIHIQETNPQTKTHTSTVMPGFVVHATSQRAESRAELQNKSLSEGEVHNCIITSQRVGETQMSC